jgi:hypothetical protein
MNKNQILNALNSGLEIVSDCNSVKVLLIEKELYFGFIGTKSAIKVQNEKELSLYNWKLTGFSEHLAR